jgi:NAD(P)-dependent dehydrogenase (short-subunit alcohol dehydrogenase family)
LLHKEPLMTKTALVAGATGITGQAVAALLHAQGWRVLGLARNPCPARGGADCR